MLRFAIERGLFAHSGATAYDEIDIRKFLKHLLIEGIF